jgi:hypothetical protein
MHILIGIPTTRGEFRERLESSSDYLRRYSDSDQDWYRFYQPHVASPLTDLMVKANALGIEVRKKATLQDLSATAIDSATVILISHWKGPEWSNDDLISPIDAARFLERVVDKDNPLARWMARRLQPRGFGIGPCGIWMSRLMAWLNKPSRVDVPGLLSRALDARLKDTPGRIAGLGPVQEQQLTRRTRRRDLLDHLFDGLVRPGNRLELYDGLHTMQEIDNALHPGFSGILDLTTCTSTPLADYLAARSEYKTHLVHFSQEQQPEWMAQLLVLTLERVAVGEAYLDARTAAIQQLTLMIKLMHA